MEVLVLNSYRIFPRHHGFIALFLFPLGSPFQGPPPVRAPLRGLQGLLAQRSAARTASKSAELLRRGKAPPGLAGWLRLACFGWLSGLDFYFRLDFGWISA